jgi:heme-degrading monooxygenase HmoA
MEVKQSMVYEIAIQTVDPARREEYIKVFSQTLRDANYAGSHEMQIFSSIEDPSRVILLIGWDNVEAHTQHRGTPTHNRMREINAGYQTAKSDGAHYRLHEVKS